MFMQECLEITVRRNEQRIAEFVANQLEAIALGVYATTDNRPANGNKPVYCTFPQSQSGTATATTATIERIETKKPVFTFDECTREAYVPYWVILRRQSNRETFANRKIPVVETTWKNREQRNEKYVVRISHDNGTVEVKTGIGFAWKIIQTIGNDWNGRSPCIHSDGAGYFKKDHRFEDWQKSKRYFVEHGRMLIVFTEKVESLIGFYDMVVNPKRIENGDDTLDPAIAVRDDGIPVRELFPDIDIRFDFKRFTYMVNARIGRCVRKYFSMLVIKHHIERFHFPQFLQECIEHIGEVWAENINDSQRPTWDCVDVGCKRASRSYAQYLGTVGDMSVNAGIPDFLAESAQLNKQKRGLLATVDTFEPLEKHLLDVRNSITHNGSRTIAEISHDVGISRHKATVRLKKLLSLIK